MGCSAHDVFKILDTLSDVVKDKISDTDNAEIKIFPGLKVTSKCVPLEQYNSNLKNVNIPSYHVLKLYVYFTHDYKRKIRETYKTH